MRLLTKELETQFKEHSIEGLANDLRSSKILVRYYNSASRGNWLVVAAEAVQDSWLLYGYFSVNGIKWSWSTYPLNNLENNPDIVMDIDTVIDETIASFSEKFLLEEQDFSYEQYCKATELYCSKIAVLKHFKEISLCTKAKCNHVLKALLFRENNIGMLVYLEQFYHNFIYSKLTLLDHYNQLIEYVLEESSKIPPSVDMDALKLLDINAVFPVLVNTELNTELLKDALHREVMDLSIIYKVDIGPYNDGCITTMVTSSIAQENGWTEEMLFDTCLKSLNNKTTYECATLQEMFPRVFEEITVPETFEYTLYVITNKAHLLGSFGIFSPKLHDLSEAVEDDLILLPSSTHEILAIKYSLANDDFDGLRTLVSTINKEVTSTEEFLSNNVYHYHRDTNEITILE